ncbi:MAG: amino acid adenylation domain-containing protein, partial [Candidatus Aminicenantes bacterium]
MENRTISDKLAIAAVQHSKERNYWFTKMSGNPVKSYFYYDYKETGDLPRSQRRMDSHQFRLVDNLFSSLMRLSKQNDYMLYMILVSGLIILVDRYTYAGNKDIILGAPIYKQDVEGDFINTVLPLRNYLKDRMTFKELLLQVKDTIVEANKQQNFPIEAILEHLNMSLSEDDFPLFDIAILLENIHDKKYLRHINLNMIFSFERTGKYIDGIVEYNASLYRESTIKSMVSHFTRVLEEALSHTDVQVSNINILSEQEKKQLLIDFNASAAGYPKEKTIHELFEEQVERTPGHTAAVGGRQLADSKGKTFVTGNGPWEQVQLTYRELDRRSNHLACYLWELGIRENRLMGLMVHRSTEMIVGILGILKAGCAYIPLNPMAPAARTNYMLKESSTGILLTTRSLVEKTNVDKDIKIVHLEDENRSSFVGRPLAGRCPQLAYIIYTSGSTGAPKGVPITHSNFSPLVHWGYKHLGIAVGDRTIQNLSYYFDWSVWEIFITLTTGASLYIIPEEILLDPAAEADFIDQNQITVLHITPTQYSYLLNLERKFKTLKYLFIGAEKLTYDLVRRSFESVGDHCRVFNMYGPTEATIISAVLEIGRNSFEQYKSLTSVPIGGPVGNMDLLVLDKHLSLCPLQVPGELCICGDGVAWGYLNNPELTAEKFCLRRARGAGTLLGGALFENFLLGTGKGFYMSHMSYKSYIYRTGDLARWLAHGTIEFLGRIDYQVKIRGFRIELGEIENQLLNHGAIKEAVVIAAEEQSAGQRQYSLCAYVVPSGEFQSSELREYLSHKLPDYMIPGYFVVLDKMPLTPNGKLDRKALPVPEIKAGAGYMGPRDELEEKLVGIWWEILGIDKDRISVNSDFFELGGHSLKANILASKIHKEFNVKIPLTEIFLKPTIIELAGYIKSASPSVFVFMELLEKKEYYAVSSVQKRLYVLQQMDQEGIAYNLPLVLMLAGDMNKEKLEVTFLELIKRHESLRTSFHMVNNEPVQRVHEGVGFEIEYFDPVAEVTGIKGGTIIRGFVRPFDLSRAPLLRVGLIKEEDQEHILIVDMHHIISDGTSMGVLVKEFMALYEGKELPRLSLQYKEYAQWEKREKEGEAIKQQEEFWLREFNEEISVLDLPTDYLRPGVRSFPGSTLSFQVDSKDTRALKTLALEQGATLYMVLLASFNIFLSKLSGQEVIVVGTPTAGRRHADLEQVMGMFVNTLALKNEPAGEKTFKGFLAELKENTLAAFANQGYQYDELVESLMIDRDTSRNPLFDTMFILQNLDIPAVEIPGLKLKPYEYDRDTSKFDLTFECIELGEHLSCVFEYSTTLFKEETIRRFIKYLKQITAAVLERPDTKIAEIDMLPAEERRQLVIDFNDTAEECPKDKTIYQLFEDQVDKFPDHVVLVFKDETVTFRQLDESANQLANYLLLDKGLHTGDPVAVLMERCIGLIASLLGVMKAGGAYVPLDASLPGERLQMVFNDASIDVVISQERFSQKLTRLQAAYSGFHSLVCLDDPKNKINKYSTARPGIIGAGNPAYVMYTSGSSGAPKGVLVEHRTIVNTLIWRKNYYEYKPGNVSLQNPPYFFDSSVTDIFTPMLGGARLVLISEEERTDLEILKKIIKANKVSHFIVIPGFYNVLVEEIADYLTGLKMITAAGEYFPDELVRKHFEKLPGVRIFNEYGPTENSVNTTAYELQPGSEKALIGKPISNVSVYILDRNLFLSPIGVGGEICLAGSSLARGYLNNPELTFEKFLSLSHRSYRSYKSYKSYISKTIYRTGDLGRWLPEGNLEFLGREDTQVKIRGIRIELEEIENRLMKRDDVKETVVLAREGLGGEKYLCAYVVLSGIAEEAPGIETSLKEYLSEKLPGYMVPSYFMLIDSIPFMPNGKIDRSALPVPELSTETRTAPGNKVEEKLLEIWAEVLGRAADTLGIDSNFFQLGGHSLRATIVASRIHKAFHVKVPVAEIFNTPFIRGLAKYITAAGEERYAAIEPVEEKEYYALSPAQKRLYLLHQMELNNVSYNLPQVIQVPGEIEKERLEWVFHQLVQRHESLRTSFEMLEDEPVQRIHDRVDFALEYYEADKVECQGIIDRFMRPFDLSRPPLLRAGLLNRTVLLLDMHHIITDGISQVILEDEFNMLAAGKGKDLPRLRLQYKDYSRWQNSEKQRALIKEQEVYWLNMFAHEIPVLNLPTDYPRPFMRSFEGSELKFVLTGKESQTLKTLAKETGTTLYMVILAVFNILVSKLSGQEDIIVGTPTAARRHADLEPIIGMFVNTLAMRNHPAEEKRFEDFLEEVKERTLEAYENQEYPFEELVDKIDVKRDTSRNPVFDVMFNLLNQEEYTGEVPGIDHQDSYKHIKRTSKFDLTLSTVDLGERLLCAFEYCTKLFTPATIERFTTYFKKLLHGLPGDSHLKLSGLEIITEAEKHLVLYEFNDTTAQYPGDLTIHQLFEEQVERTPDHIALVGAHELHEFHELHEKLEGTRGLAPLASSVSITYKELNKRSNQLACLLRAKGVQPDTIVGIMMERSIEIIIGILGILKAGGAYLPIDNDYPQDRIRTMLEDCCVSILIGEAHVKGKHSFTGLEDLHLIGHENKSEEPRWIAVNNITPGEPPEMFQGEDEKNPDHINQPPDLAYIIFTSGSTGKPKGVLIQHRNVVRLMFNDRFLFDFNSHDVWTLFHSCCFDFSVWEMYGALLYGGRLVVIPKMVARDTATFLEILKREKVTVLNQVPSAFYNLSSEELKYLEKKLNLKYIIFGGEALKPVKLKELKRKYPGTKFVNMYGITETTVHVTYKEIGDKEIDFNLCNIGRAIPTLTTYVMDKNLKLQPRGVPGELVVGGEGPGRGYLNRPELTKEKFVNHPDIPDQRLYRSGDLGKFLKNGEIEYLGRIDQQVKIRGFRIELGEIENCLMEIDHIKEAVAAAREDNTGEMYLYAYVVSKTGEDINGLELKNRLSGRLPSYMVPSYIVPLEKIPLTPSGKVDREALPEPVGDEWAEDDALPGHSVKMKLVELWSEVLGVEKENINIHAHFFQLGGNSLRASNLSSRLQKAFNVKIPLSEIFKSPTIKGLLKYIKNAKAERYASVESAEKKEYYVLSPGQKRLYLLDQMELNNISYNIPQVIPFPGEIDKERLEWTFKELVKRHESLRTSFEMMGEEPIQRVHEDVEFAVQYYDAQEAEAREIIDNFMRPFDLSQPPLLRADLIKIQSVRTPSSILLLDMHHIITDGASQAVLTGEFHRLYTDEEETLPPLRIQYKDYSQWQNSDSQQALTKEQEAYWLEGFSNELPVLNLPFDYPRPFMQSFEGNTVNFLLAGKESQTLKALSKKANATLYMTILSVFNILLSKLSGQEDIIVGTPILGRHHADLESIIGMFVNTLAMRNHPAGEKRFKDFLEEVKERTLEAYENQEYQFEDLVDRIDVRRDTGRNPIFDVMFNLSNQDEYTDKDKDKEIIPGIDAHEQQEHLEQGTYTHRKEPSKFDLMLTVVDLGERLPCAFQYCTKLFKPATIERFIAYFKRIVGFLSEDSDLKISGLEIITEAERHQVLYEFNDTSAEYPGDMTIHRLFEKQVERTPDHIALVGAHELHELHEKLEGTRGLAPLPGAVSITYKELNQKSHQLAHLLKEKGVLADNIVGIMVGRSMEMMIAISGILKSEGAYLPIDPEYPEERINYILKDSSARILLTTRTYTIGKTKENIDFDGEIVYLEDNLFHQKPGTEHCPVPTFSAPAARGLQLAYVIYTSGTTGKPKGTMIRHHSLVNRLNWMQKQYPLDERDTILHKTPFTFDVSVWEILWWGVTGAKACLLGPGGEKDPGIIIDAIERTHITMVHFVPSMLNAFLDHLAGNSDARKLAGLKQVIASGEALTVSQVKRFYNLLHKENGTGLANLYGPTEATIDVSYYDCFDDYNLEAISIPIGKPIDNIQLYILDNHLHLQPVGIAGELCIAGVGLARGYLNRCELTAEKFCLRRPGALFEKTAPGPRKNFSLKGT